MTAREKIDQLLMARVSKQRVTSQSLRTMTSAHAKAQPRAILLFLDLSRSFLFFILENVTMSRVFKLLSQTLELLVARGFTSP